MMDQIDPITRIRVPLGVNEKEPGSFNIQALFNEAVHPIVMGDDPNDQAFQLMQKPFKMCVQKQFGDTCKRHHELVID